MHALCPCPSSLTPAVGPQVRVGEVSSFLPSAVQLADGSTLPCDLVVFGTGFKKQYDVLPEQVGMT